MLGIFKDSPPPLGPRRDVTPVEPVAEPEVVEEPVAAPKVKRPRVKTKQTEVNVD